LFRDFFELNESDDHSRDTACIMSVEGRTHPVAIYHTKTAVPNYIKATVETVLEIHKKEIPGDILVFLTGQEEVIEEEIKRRFAAEEGDHIALLNVYTMFMKNNKSRKWCGDHYLNYRGLCRADNVRAQLVRLLRRFEVPLVSARGEPERLEDRRKMT
ncbi:hypothetical protein NECAME_17973, partial [Necator americanus]